MINETGFNTALRAVDTEEIKSSGVSVEDGLLEHATFGTVTSVTSAAVGIYNSGKALINSFGGDFALSDEAEVIGDVFGAGAEQYYGRHKAGVDFAGFLIGSTVGGLGALRALKLAQSAGKLTFGLESATGLYTGDLVLGSKALQSAKAAALSNATAFSWRNPATYKVIALGSGNQLAENLVFEAGALLLNNQNVLVNPDGEGAFSAIAHQFTEGLPFLAGATAFTSLIEAGRIVGAVKSAYREANAAAAPYTVTVSTAVSTLPAGDRLVYTTGAKHQLETDPKLNPIGQAVQGVSTDEFNSARRLKGMQQLETMSKEAMLELNKVGQSGLDALTQVQQAAPAQAADMLAGMIRLRPVTNGEYVDMFHYFARTQVGNVVGKDAEAAAGAADIVARKLGKAAKLKGKAQDEVLVSELKGLRDSKLGNPAYVAVLRQESIKSGSQLYPELERMSRVLFPDSWAAVEAKHAKSLVDGSIFAGKIDDPVLAKQWQNILLKDNDIYAGSEAGSIVKLLNDTATILHNPELAKRYAQQAPSLTGFVLSNTPLKSPFKPTSRFYNIRTKVMSDGALPLAQDLGRVVETGGRIVIEGTQHKFMYMTTLFSPTEMVAAVKRADMGDKVDTYMHASAMWAAAAQRPLQIESVKGVRTVNLHTDDLPMLERVVQSSGYDKFAVDSIVLRGMPGTENKVLSVAEAKEYLISRKEDLRAELQKIGTAESTIGVLLNSGESFSLGLTRNDALLMGVRKYDRPEHVVAEYAADDLRELNASASAYDSIQARMEAQQAARLEASAQVLGESYMHFPELKSDLIRDVSPTDQRTTMVFSNQADFGSAREQFNYVGRMTYQAKDASRVKGENMYAQWYEIFDKRENVAQRAQLALATNIMRQSPQVLIGDYMVSADRLSTAVANYVGEKVSKAEAMARITELLPTDPYLGAIKLHPDVRNFLAFHKEQNAALNLNDVALAGARGKSVVRDSEILYPPPLRLKETPHFAFISPRPSMQDADPAKYMIYGRTAEELEEKVAAINKAYPEQYDIRYKKDIELDKKLLGEYDEGRVFNEWDFNTSMKRSGTATDFVPNLEAQGSVTLDMYRNWWHRRSEAQIMQAVELKYADIMEGLKSLDTAFDAPAVSRLGSRVAPSTIYADTRNVMLDKKGYGGIGEDLYKTVTGAISGKLGDILDIVPKLYAQKNGKLSDAEVEALSDSLRKAGFISPVHKGIELALQSSSIPRGRSFDNLVRSTNNLVSAFMLRLDPLHSLVQLLSTPILLSGAVREAKRALAGTEAGSRLHALTTVRNPVNGVAEPTATKMMGIALKRLATGESKAFAQELRDRGILTDYLRQYNEALEFSEFTGGHAIRKIEEFNERLSKLSKYTGHHQSEDISRYVVADVFRQIAELRGLSKDETFAMIGNAIDKVHGVYRASSRAQLFRGSIGQAIGLYQTYMFNFMQNMLKHVQAGDKKTVAITAALQSSVFGVRSLPAFNFINQHVANTNAGDVDIYTLTGSDSLEGNEKAGLGAYLMYGLGGYALGVPVDVFSRGDMAVRHATIVPTQVPDIPAVATIAKAVANLIDTGGKLWDADNLAQVRSALAYGLAHNGFNRPLQGLGVIAAGEVTSNNGTPMFINVNNVDYDPAKMLNFAAMGVRITGGKPMREAMLMDTYYRRNSYQAENSANIRQIAEDIRVASGGDSDSDAISTEQYDEFAQRYERNGGSLERFNAFVTKQLIAGSEGSLEQFREKMAGDNAFTRTYERMHAARSTVSDWEQDSLLVPQAVQ